MKVAGLDLSMTASGVAVTGRDGTCRTHLVEPAGKGDRRLVDIRSRILAYITGCELVLIEDLPPVRGQALAILGMVHGAVREGLLRFGIEYATVSVAGLKKYATGRGTADKTAMAVAAFRRAELEFKDNNQCDAWWLWVMAMDLLGAPVFELPKIQREALVKIRRGAA